MALSASGTAGLEWLATRVYRDFNALDTFGREPESLKSITSLFAEQLAPYPLASIERAFSTHARRSRKFPTPFDIRGLIERHGKPPFSEAIYISIARKDYADRSAGEQRYLRDYEEFAMSGWGDDVPVSAPDAERSREETGRLREQVKSLQAEIERLAELLRIAQSPRPRISPTESARIAGTIRYLQANSPGAAVEEFASGYGITDPAAYVLEVLGS